MLHHPRRDNIRPGRQGWPVWAVARLECANCGTLTYHHLDAPHKTSHHYVPWACAVWPDARAAQTQYGFRLWCSLQCQHTWESTRHKPFEESHMKEHRREMERRALGSGAF
jgi:hypothetical protein